MVRRHFPCRLEGFDSCCLHNVNPVRRDPNTVLIHSSVRVEYEPFLIPINMQHEVPAMYVFYVRQLLNQSGTALTTTQPDACNATFITATRASGPSPSLSGYKSPTLTEALDARLHSMGCFLETGIGPRHVPWFKNAYKHHPPIPDALPLRAHYQRSALSELHGRSGSYEATLGLIPSRDSEYTGSHNRTNDVASM